MPARLVRDTLIQAYKMVKCYMYNTTNISNGSNIIASSAICRECIPELWKFPSVTLSLSKGDVYYSIVYPSTSSG